MRIYRVFVLSFFIIVITAFVNSPEGNILVSNKGEVSFVSSAPLETIKAESKKISGVLDVEKRTFAFSIPINSFEGFNSPLQKEHFNENYLESDKLPKGYFKGKIIEEVNLLSEGIYTIRAKGMMNIHGIEKEMIIKSKITSTSNRLLIESSFNVLLNDFGIKIPKIVNQKIAEEISVNVKVEMNPKN